MILLLIGLISTAVLPINVRDAESASPIVKVQKTRLELLCEQREAYLRNKDLNSMVAYGEQLDTTLIELDSVRASLEKEFYIELAKEAGRRYGPQWQILYGVWMRESRMDPTAKGDGVKDKRGRIIRYRAFGLGQIHEPTAKTHYDKNITAEQLMDPIINGMASAKTLQDYTVMFGGNIKYGISAYQQGPVETRKQFKNKQQPKNISYVTDVLQNAAEVAQQNNGSN